MLKKMLMFFVLHKLSHFQKLVKLSQCDLLV